MYVISLKRDDRLENIKTQQDKINSEITIFDAVKGDKLNFLELYESGIIAEYYKYGQGVMRRQIGCYMSHLNLLKQINLENKVGYSIIFEDDFLIDSLNFLNDVNEILTKVDDFDLLFLGNVANNKGESIVDNIYKMDPYNFLWGTQGYIVNNKNINKIIDSIKLVDMPIDDKYAHLGRLNILKILVIQPNIVYQQNDKLPSEINNFSFETFTNYLFSFFK